MTMMQRMKITRTDRLSSVIMEADFDVHFVYRRFEMEWDQSTFRTLSEVFSDPGT
jgi:hypothetical protein